MIDREAYTAAMRLSCVFASAEIRIAELARLVASLLRVFFLGDTDRGTARAALLVTPFVFEAHATQAIASRLCAVASRVS